ncbi:MAG: DUF3800 domain-containing protein [Gemmatimonadaceae bacterium]
MSETQNDQAEPEVALNGDEAERRRLEREAKERERIQQAVDGHIDDSRLSRVSSILSRYQEARDSDITLARLYWEEFEPVNFKRLRAGDDTALYDLTRSVTLSRVRARIQNTHGLFVARPEIRAARKRLSEEEKERLALELPPAPVLTVYADETGKTGKVLLVGSVWVPTPRETSVATRSVAQWKEAVGFTREFHYTEMRRDDLPLFVKFVELMLEMAPTVSFKSIQVPREGLRADAALPRLISSLIIRGIEHERDSRRITLPRELLLFKDQDGEGADKLCLAEVEQHLEHASLVRFDKQLAIQRLTAVPSETSVFVQLADLYAGSLQRVAIRQGAAANHKDDFADYLLARVAGMAGVTLTDMIELGEAGDLSVQFHL